MARITLETPGEDVLVGGDDINLFGTTAGGEVITVVDTAVGTDVVLDGSFAAGGDTVLLAGEAEAYVATVVGSRVVLTSSTGTTISIPVGTAGIAVEFGGDDTRVLRVVDGQLVFGGQVIAPTGETTLDPGNDEASVADLLVVLQSTEEALNEFEVEQGATAAELRLAVTQAQTDLAAARSVTTDAQLQAALTTANANLDAAEIDVAAIPGLTAAVQALFAAEAVVAAEFEDLTAAREAEDVAVAAYNARTGDDIATADNLVLQADGTFAGSVETTVGQTLIVVDDVTGQPRLANGVTEATNPGVTALLQAIVAEERAEASFEQAVAAEAAAQARVDLLDQVPSADVERQAVEEFDAAVDAYVSALNAYEANQTAGNATALQNAYAGLVAEGVAAVVADTDGDTVIEASEIRAQAEDVATAVEGREDTLDAALLAAEASNPLVSDLRTALQAQADAQEAADDRQDLIQDVADAQAVVAVVVVLETAIVDARTDIEDAGFNTPLTVEGQAEVGTAGNDIFLFADQSGAIQQFGAQGDDVLFIGTDFSVQTVAEGVNIANSDVGDVSELEVFIQQVGNDTVLYFEDVSFAGNTTTGAFQGTTVTLEGVDASTVSFDATGFIQIDDLAVG